MKRLSHKVPGSISKMRLDEYLQMWLGTALGETLSKTKIRNLIMSGSVYVNRHRDKTPTTMLYSGAFLEVYYDEEKATVGKVKWAPVRLRAESILFEDEWIIVMNKPPGLPTQPTVDPNRPNLFDLTQQLLIAREKDDKAYLGLHHRLDKDTSGVVLFTKKEEANVGVSKLFQEHLIEKTYQCLAWRSPLAEVYEAGAEFNVTNFLGKISESNDITKYGEVRSGGLQAITDFKVLDSFRDVYWLQAKPKTGRTHQIRVHCEGIKLPILGDPLYFPEDLVPFMVTPRLMLHALMIRFIHPITHKEIQIESPLTEDFVSMLGSLKK